MIEILLPIEDTCISKYNAKVNFGKSDSLLIGSSSSRNDYYKTLLKFDISSIFSKVSIARVLLRLYVYKKEKTGQQEITAYKLLQNFKEMEANWDNQPSHEEVGYSSILTDGNMNGYFDIDVTSIINQWLNDKTETVHGIEVIASESASSFIWFRSREYNQDYMWPKLIVEYNDSKLVTDSKENEDVSIESCNLYQLGNNFSAAYKVKKLGTKETLTVLEISDDGLVWFSEKTIEVVNDEYKVIGTSSPREYDRISLVIIKEPELFLHTGKSVLAQDNVTNKNSVALNYTSNNINIPVDESGQITVNKTGTANIRVNPKSVQNSHSISFKVVGQVNDDEELSNALDDASITNINIPAGDFTIFNHTIDASRNITISGMIDEHGKPITNLILSDMYMYISSLDNIKITLENINIIGLTPNTNGINFIGQFLMNSSISFKNVHMRNFNTTLYFEMLANIDITECEFTNNNEALVFNNATNCRVSKTKFKDNSKASVTIEDSCSNMDISSEFENSPSNDFIGISIINNQGIPSNINITGSSFIDFDWHKRVTYTNITDLPEYHVIYGVPTETDLRDVLTNWTEIGTINVLQNILNISNPIEIKRPVILSGISRQVTISAASNIGNLNFTPYSAVIAADSSNVTIENLTVDGNNFAQNGIYVHRDSCSIYNNIIKNIIRPEGKRYCGDGIIAYREGTTTFPSPINTLNAASNTIINTARYGIFVEAFNTETKQFFMSTNINVTSNVVDNVWNNPLTPIETQEPNGIFSAAIELQGLQKSTTEFKGNLISDVKNNLKESYIYFIDTDETLINGVLESHNANLSSIKIENYSVDLSQALITATNPNGTILLVSTDTTTGISITQGEPNETVVVKVVRNGETTVIDKTQWNSYNFKINDEILVECTSQDKVVTNVYKITISKKTLRHVTVSTEIELIDALSDDSVGHISLLNNITLTKALSINKYVILDSNGNNKFTLTTLKAGNDITLGNGADKNELNNLKIDGELIIDIGPYASISLHNVTATLGTRVLSGDVNSIHLYGINTPILRFFGNARVILDEDTSSGTPIKSIVGEIILNPPSQGTPVQILQIIGSEVTNLEVQSQYSNISIEQDATVTNLNIQEEHSSILIDQGASVINLAIDGSNTNVEIKRGGTAKTVQIDAGNTSLTLDNGSGVETLNLNSNNLTIDGKNITHVNIQSGVTDISTIDVKGFEQTDPSMAEANNSLAVVFALTQSNITTIKLDGIFEGIPITGKSINNINGPVDNKIVTIDDTKVLKFSIIVYSIIKVNLLPGIYDEALEIKRSITLQGSSGVILRQKNEKIATETAITISADDVKIIGFEIRDWNIGIENKQDKKSYKNIIISDNIIYSPKDSNYGIYMGYDAEAFLYPPDDLRHLDDMIDFKGLTIINNQISGYNNHGMIIESVKASEGKLIIDNNDIYNSKGYGIWIDTSKNINVQNNKIHENAVYGIYFSSTAEGIHSTTGKVPSDITIINNEITDNVISNLSFDSADLSTIKIADNSITNKVSNGKLIENNLTTTTEAPKNWWGTAYKPTIQSKIIGSANFIPYYVNASKTTLSNVKTDIHVNSSYTDGNSGSYIYGYSAFSNIQEALEKAKEFS
ncbi:DNRLRE domain-containing protein [Clostridium sp. P21]|uniref:DNRLRE domain-containing protein n=1 Tax=Clostridium muellerianum TaxID=2716538 RepID=A0A7Y0HNB4_9CLOT|nr:DNRLRE domain-containing protein [Clostridium muellerianum]NMM61831.1 DNRLRE domain-containing protein [Clostridium muellerianum]